VRTRGQVFADTVVSNETSPTKRNENEKNRQKKKKKKKEKRRGKKLEQRRCSAIVLLWVVRKNEMEGRDDVIYIHGLSDDPGGHRVRFFCPWYFWDGYLLMVFQQFW